MSASNILVFLFFLVFPVTVPSLVFYGIISAVLFWRQFYLLAVCLIGLSTFTYFGFFGLPPSPTPIFLAIIIGGVGEVAFFVVDKVKSSRASTALRLMVGLGLLITSVVLIGFL